MDSAKVIQLIQKEQSQIVYHHFNHPGLNCIDECRGLITGILELASEEERLELLRSIVKYKFPETIQTIQEGL